MLNYPPAAAASHTWSSNTPPIVANGDTITISTGAEAAYSSPLVIPASATVTIVGGSSSAPISNGSRVIAIDIGVGAKVIWQAHYRGGEVLLYRAGEFELKDGSILAQSIDPALSCNGPSVTVTNSIVRSAGRIALLVSNAITLNINNSIVETTGSGAGVFIVQE